MHPTGSVQERIHKAALELFANRGVTQISVSELAEAAGVARGTIYNNLERPEALFETVAAEQAADMDRRISTVVAGITDPAERLAAGVRFWVRRAHAEPNWGRFLVRFAFGSTAGQTIWSGSPVADVLDGVRMGRYTFRPEQLPSVAAMIAGTALGAIFLVLDGRRTWRDAGADAVEFILVALGVQRDEARTLAEMELPPLPDIGS